MRRRVRLFALYAICGLLLGDASASSALAVGEKLELTVVDADTGQPIPCRLHLRDNRGRPRRLGRLPALGDHLVIDGHVTLELPLGSYQFEIERGPEYVNRTGHFVLEKFSDDTKTVDLKRIVDLSQEGWWSGDLHLARPVDQVERLMLAEDLHVAANVSWKNGSSPKAVPENSVLRFDGNRYCDLLAGRDERTSGALLFFGLKQPLTLPRSDAPSPTLAEMATAGRDAGAWVDIENPLSWDLPVLLAQGRVDSFQLAHGDLQRKQMAISDLGSRPRDKNDYPDPLGPGGWTQKIYYHLLESGFRVPPSAGSGSGDNDNPPGYNRMYVHVESEFTWERWWENFRAGRVFVTNGPLIRPSVQGQLPGHVFTSPAGGELELQVLLSMATRDPVPYLEIVQNGRVAHVVRLNDWAKENGKLPPLRFTESGWFLVRTVADNDATYRFASTAPYYVEIGDRPRISRGSAQFFLDWVEARLKALEAGKAPAEAVEKQRNELEAAKRFWKTRVADATVD